MAMSLQVSHSPRPRRPGSILPLLRLETILRSNVNSKRIPGRRILRQGPRTRRGPLNIIEDILLTPALRDTTILLGAQHTIELKVAAETRTAARRDKRLRLARGAGVEVVVALAAVRGRGGLAVCRAQPVGVAEQGLDTREGDDDCGDEAFAVGPAEGDGEVGDVAEGVVGAQDCADHDEDAGGEHDCQDDLALDGDLEFHQDGDWDCEDDHVGSGLLVGVS